MSVESGRTEGEMEGPQRRAEEGRPQAKRGAEAFSAIMEQQ